MTKKADQQATEFDAQPASAPAVSISASKGTLRYRTADGTDTAKDVDAIPGGTVWLEADAKGNAEATITTTWPLEGGTYEQVVTEPGVIYG